MGVWSGVSCAGAEPNYSVPSDSAHAGVMHDDPICKRVDPAFASCWGLRWSQPEQSLLFSTDLPESRDGPGRAQERDYEHALEGIRATLRGEQPIKPDAYLFLHKATVLLECGLRPDECYRLKLDQIQDGAITFRTARGKVPNGAHLVCSG